MKVADIIIFLLIIVAMVLPDLLLMKIDAPANPNSFRYQIGWNLGSTGQATGRSAQIQGPANGNNNSGGGAALGDIDINGNVTGWSGKFIGPAMGNMTNGGGVAVGHINRNEFTDILLMTVDDPYGID